MVIDIKAVTWALPVAHPGNRAVEAVAKPVQGETEHTQQQNIGIPPRQGVADTCHALGDEAQDGQVVRVNPGGHSLCQPEQGAFLSAGQETLLNPDGRGEFEFPRSGCSACGQGRHE